MTHGRLAPASMTAVATAGGRFRFGLTSRSLFLLVLGLIWIVPLMPLIRWMAKPDEP